MIRDAVARYATRFHRLLGGTHGVASPFGAWLLLALVAPAADGALRESLEDVLGCDADAAFDAAAALLRDPHAELVLGSAIWHDPDRATERLLDLVQRLSPPADAGPIPSQAEADAWARERTRGLIERFPIDIEKGDPLAILLATAIAAKVSWTVPFLVAAPAELVLAADPTFRGVPVLREPGVAEWLGVADTEVGPVAAVTARSRKGLLVTSVIADPAADPATVLDVAQQIAIGVATGQPLRARSLFDLPLGDGHAWRVTEQQVSHTGSNERYELLLPAWEAFSDLALLDPQLGFRAAGDALIALLPPDDYYVEAKQSAMARYTREGFEAAAVTALGVRAASMPMQRVGPVRTARVEFTRPHAVVAATEGDGLWDGLPVFSAWVGQAVPAE
jgi:hypothetical protein